MNKPVKLYLLCLEILPLLDEVEIEGVKINRMIERLKGKLEVYANDAANEFYKHDALRDRHDALVRDFSQLIDSIKL